MFAQIAVVIALVALAAYPLGLYMAAFFAGKPTFLDPVFGPIDRGLARAFGVGPDPVEMTWKRYATALLLTNMAMALLVFIILVSQRLLPLNPLGLVGMEPMQAFNTAASFITNTNWQSYGGESTLSYLSQMSLTYLQFTSGATGICVTIAVLRGFAGHVGLGNFYVDMAKIHSRVLLPLCVIATLFLVWQGTPQTLASSVAVMGPQATAQTVPLGPVASMVAIKHLGTNGGGYYSQNSAHPLENPTPLTGVLHNWLLLVISASLLVTFGRMLGRPRQALVVAGVMGLLFVTSLGLLLTAESGGGMEGKEVRVGAALTSLFIVSTTATSTGSVVAMHDSLSPLGGLVPMANMMLNDIFGGVGVGILNFLIYAIVAVFLTGLMVGRTPEIFGKKVEQPEIVLASILLLLHPLLILTPTAFSLVMPFGLTSLTNTGPHGLSEILYAFTSGAANNGSAFAGLNANTPWYNIAIGIVMLIGRFPALIAFLAIAGSLAAKRPVPVGPGTLRTDTPLFAGIFLATILIVGALTFFPVLALGPIAEHLAMLAGKRF